jgi:Mrp family chromosome partitioning ATPase
MTANARHRPKRGLLRTYGWLILTATAATLVVAAAVAAATPLTYTSSAQVEVRPQQTTGAPLQPQMGTERAIVKSGAVAQRAAERLGTSPRAARAGLSVSVLLETTVVQIEYTADTAEEAVDGARAFTYAYVDYRNSDSAARVAEVVTIPELPTRGSGANLVLVLGLGALAGIALGIGAAVALDRATDRLRDAEQLEEHTGLPVLGNLPKWDERAGWLAPPGSARDAVSFLASRLVKLTGNRRQGVTLVVTSPRSGGGTTTVAVNTALALAALGRDVVLVGADLHAPRLHECLGLVLSPGLLDVVDGDRSAEMALQRTSLPNLRVLAAGVRPGAEPHLHVDQVRLVLGQLAAHAVVVVDAPPLLTWAESLLLADQADAVLLVADFRSGTRSDAADAVALGQGFQSQIAGWVVNRPQRRSRRTWGSAGESGRATVPEEPGPAPIVRASP